MFTFLGGDNSMLKHLGAWVKQDIKCHLYQEIQLCEVQYAKKTQKTNNTTNRLYKNIIGAHTYSAPVFD